MKKTLFIAIVLLCTYSTFAQYRAYSKDGLNEFETPKAETEIFDKVKLNIGGHFNQSFQALSHSNTADPKMNAGIDQNKLIDIGPGFNTATANLYFDVHLAEGVYMNMALYLSSRHHNETWVKGGYIRFDKLPFIKSDLLDNLMKYVSIKVGHMEINYGDAHFRRTDNGNGMYNPFIESYIMDAFTTEIGTEINVSYKGFLASASVTNGMINGRPLVLPEVVGISDGKADPAFIAKAGYDNQLTDDLRVRLTGSVYYTSGSNSNTLYGGDRAGSHYYGVLDNALTTSTFTSGRLNPGFGDKVTAMMGNLFVKFGGFESFTTIESTSGRGRTEVIPADGERSAGQFATDLLYRFGKNEQFWVGARYNAANARLVGYSDDIKIDRIAVSTGWYVTKNLMAKLEYVKQNYNGFNSSDIRNGGQFNGIALQAVVGF
jgi:hypothetical protein